MRRNRLAAIIDVQSDGVGGALVESRFDSTARAVCSRALAVHRKVPNFQHQLNRDRLFSDLAAALKEVLAELFSAGRPRPDAVVFFLAAPFYAAQTRTIKQTNQKPVTVTRRLVAALTEQDAALFQSQLPPLYPEIIDDTHELIEHKIMQIKLNRYETHAPFGQTANEIEINHYLSVGSTKILNRFRELVEVYLPRARPQFHSFAFAFYAVGRDSLGVRHGLFLDFGAEISEVFFVNQGVLWELVSFPFGRNYLIRELARALGTVPEEAFSALKIYGRRGHNELANERLRSAATRAGKKWFDQFRAALAALTETHLAPKELLAVGDAVVASVFLDWLKEADFQAPSVAEKNFHITLLTSETLQGRCPAPPENLSTDEHLLLETIFYDKLMKLANDKL